MPNYIFRVNNTASWFIQRSTVLSVSSQTPTIFYNLLSTASASRDRLTGVEESRETLKWRTKAICGINECLNDPKRRFSDETLAAVAGAVRTEHALGRWSSFAIHCRGFVQILRSRGGWRSLRNNPDLEEILIILQLIFSKKQVDVLLNPLTEVGGASCPSGLLDVLELRNDVWELVELLNNLVDWVEDSKAISRDLLRRNLRHAYDRRVTMFGRDSFLLRLLGAPLFLVSPNELQIEAEHSNHLFCLFYFAIAMWEYRDLPVECIAFINRLSNLVHDHNIDSTLTRSKLIWPLLKGADDDWPEKKWKSVRMVKVTHLLQEETTDLLKHFLLALLDPSNTQNPPTTLMTKEVVSQIKAEALTKLPFTSQLLHDQEASKSGIEA